MAQSIQIAGASYPDVPSIVVPKVGSGTAVFADPSGVTAVAADVASGKMFLDSSGALIPGTASGGGGASNVVTGTFKGTTTGAAMDVNLSYTGNGYPVAVAVYPSDGYQNGSSAYDILQRYATIYFSGVKRTSDTPTYETSGAQNQFVAITAYKSSATTANTISQSGSMTMNTLGGTAAGASLTSFPVRFKDAKTMSVYIASTSYGFLANIEYTYHVIYSS